MGVYIPDMEMPKPGEVIRIYNNGEARRCRVTEQEAFEVGIAFPVPPHGRLIDADALIDWIYSDEPNAWKAPFRLCTADRSDVKFLLKQAPTIIQASEEGET